jgi:hypothetical protein
MGYQYYVNANDKYVGIKLVSGGTAHFYAIDNDGANGSINLGDGFSKTEKYQIMSSVSRLTAGMASANGNDASMLLSAGPFNIPAGDSVKVTFALLAADSLPALLTAATAAQARYDTLSAGLPPSPSTGIQCLVYPNPAENGFSLFLHSPKNETAKIQLMDMTGRVVFSAVEKLPAGQPVHRHFEMPLAAGTYLCEVNIGSEKIVSKVVVW